MDARRFSTEAWMPNRKISVTSKSRGVLLPRRPFLLVTFLWASKEKQPAAQQWNAFALESKSKIDPGFCRDDGKGPLRRQKEHAR